MQRFVRYTDHALVDLSDIRKWLTQPGSGAAARKRLMSIRSSIHHLRRYPYLSAISLEPGIRELPCKGGYRILYTITADTGDSATAGDVVVLRVFGPGQSRRDP